MTISVLPMEGLTPGTYDDSIYVDASEVAEYMTIAVTFTVGGSSTGAAILQSIVKPTAVTGLTNGISVEELITRLPSTVHIVTSMGEMDALVDWDDYNLNYDPANKARQTCEIIGLVNLPSEVSNPNDIEEYVTLSVTVNAAARVINPKLKTPTAPKISIFEDRVKLTWNKVPKATSYTIYRKRGGLISEYDITIKNSYTDYEIFNGTHYTYYIVANANGYKSSSKSKGTAVTYLAEPTSPTVRSTKTKTATVSWRKNSRATGYQIRYSLKSNMASAKTVKIAKAGTVKRVFKNLKRKKNYYFQIRAYKTVGSKTFYSVWSGKKKVKVK